MKFINKWLSLVNKRDLVTSVTASIIVLSIIACGSSSILNTIGNPAGGDSLITHLISLPFSGHRIVPASSSKFVAAFATISTASQLGQSYDVQCTVTQGTANTTFPLMEIPSTQFGACSNAGSITDETINTFNGVPNPAPKPTFTDGTLTSLVVTGKTLGNQKFQCRDLTSGFAILDNSSTAAFLDTVAHTVRIFNQAPNGTITPEPFTCTGIGTDTDPVSTIDVMFVKQ